MARLLCTWALLAGCCAQALAQSPAFEGTLPDTVVVTASRMAEEARTTGRRVQVWTARDIAALPVASLDELLRVTAGVEIQSRGGFGIQSDFTIRGSTFNGVLLLVDGVRINDPMTGHFLSDFPIPLPEIARVEVLRGPATALYGPDAIGGVIHVLTYSGLAQDEPVGTGEQLHLAYGANELFNMETHLRRYANGLWSAAAAWQRSDGEPILDENGQPFQRSAGGNDPRRFDVRTDFERGAVSLAYGSKYLYARGGYDARQFGAYRFYTPFPSDTARENTTTAWLQTRLGSRTGWHADASLKQHEDTYWFFPSLAPNEHISRLGQVQVTGPLLTRARVQVVAGGSAHVRNITSNNLGEHDDAGAGVFTSTRWQATDALTVNASLRVDVDPAFGTEPTPQLGLAYLVSPSWIVRASGGRSVRAPNYVERYFNTELARPRGRDLGNPDLRAERAWSAEAGTDLYLPGGLDVHATVFGRRTNDLIDFALLTPADTVFRAQNLLEVDTQGFELEAALRRPLASGALLLTASLSGLDADLGAVDEQVTYKYALSNARRLWQASATYTDERASVGLKALRKELLAGGSYFIVDARTSLSLGRLGFSFEIRNLLDRAHSDVFDAPLPRRWWIAGVRIGR